MAAIAETVAHGTPQALLGISDEPASSPTVKVAELTNKFTRDNVPTKNTNGTTVYEVENDPKFIQSFTGQLNASSGLAVAGPGTAVATVANFASTTRTFDSAVGVHILENIEDSVKNLDRAPNTKFDIRSMQHIA